MVYYFHKNFVEHFSERNARINSVAFYRASVDDKDNATGIAIEGKLDGKPFRVCLIYTDSYLGSEYGAILNAEQLDGFYADMVDSLDQDSFL